MQGWLPPVVQRAAKCPGAIAHRSQQTEWPHVPKAEAGAFSNLPIWSRRPNQGAYSPEMSPSPGGRTKMCVQLTLHWLPNSTAADKSWRKQPHSLPELNWLYSGVRQEEVKEKRWHRLTEIFIRHGGQRISILPLDQTSSLDKLTVQGPF